MYALKVKLTLSTHFDLTVAIATVHRSTATRFEGYFGVFTALGTYRREHLALGPIAVAVATISILLCFPCLAALGATLGLVGVAFGVKKLLFSGVEGEDSPAIGTLERLVLKTHWMTSSLLNFS